MTSKIKQTFLLLIYWTSLWKKKGNIGIEFLNPSNLKIVNLQRVWEFTQIIASINYISRNNLKGKKILEFKEQWSDIQTKLKNYRKISSIYIH